MKKIIYIISALALMAGFTACTEKEGDDINLDEIVLDGFYVYGEATGAGTSVLSKNAMSVARVTVRVAASYVLAIEILIGVVSSIFLNT